MHISRLNCAKMVVDRPRQPAYEIFSIECRFLPSRSQSFTFNEACARRRTQVSNMGNPLKIGGFCVIRLSSVKTLADRYRCTAYHNKHW